MLKYLFSLRIMFMASLILLPLLAGLSCPPDRYTIRHDPVVGEDGVKVRQVDTWPDAATHAQHPDDPQNSYHEIYDPHTRKWYFAKEVHNNDGTVTYELDEWSRKAWEGDMERLRRSSEGGGH